MNQLSAVGSKKLMQPRTCGIKTQNTKDTEIRASGFEIEEGDIGFRAPLAVGGFWIENADASISSPGF
jgi:hypothetical protein